MVSRNFSAVLIPTKCAARYRGSVLIYSTILMSVMLWMGVLAVDWGRTRVAKAEAQVAADAGARYGAGTLQNIIAGQSAASASAIAAAIENEIDGSAIQASNCVVEIGLWNTTTRAFTPMNTPVGANAVRVTVKHIFNNSRGTLSFAPIFGSTNTTVSGQAVAMVSQTSQNFFAQADGNLWLSAMPTGTVTKNLQPGFPAYWDTAGPTAESPTSVATGGVVIPGSAVTFDGVNGTGSYNANQNGTTFTADGDPASMVCHGGAWFNNTLGNFSLPDNGIANLKVPIGSLVGVYLDNNDPRFTSAPTPLDFSAAASRDFSSLAPQLKQPFLIGDGRRSNGEVQQFIVPTGAKRLYVGMMDAWEWRGNVGGFDVTAHSNVKIVTVK